MTVIFATPSKTQRRFSINNLVVKNEKGEEVSYGPQFFKNGALATSDKDLIKALMKWGGYKRGDYKLASNPELVGKYLAGEESDKLTADMLDKISIEGIKRLGKLLGSKESQPVLIKIEIEGADITSGVREVLDFYHTKMNVPQEPQSEIEAFEPVISTSMNVRKAMQHIKETPIEDLATFIAASEDRKTVLEAYEEKMNKTEG